MTTQNDPLNLYDRVSLRTWRLMNIATWVLAGIAAKLVVHVVMGNIDTIVREGIYRGYSANDVAHGWLVVADWVIGGAVLGTLIGRRVFRSAPAYAGIAVVLASVFGFRIGEWTGSSVSLPGSIIVPIVVALAAAVRAERRRPQALRGGRAAQ